MTGKRGVTLLEMLVASAIMALAVVGLLSALSGAVRNASNLRDYDRAVLLAQTQMNELLLDDRLPRDSEVTGRFDPRMSGGLESGWRARRTSFQMPPAVIPNEFAMDRVQLEVWWVSGRTRRSFFLDGYRRRTLKAEDMLSAGVR